jgi:hypothetical protein
VAALGRPGNRVVNAAVVHCPDSSGGSALKMQNGSKPAHLWKPGQSGNPAGRPRSAKPFKMTLARILEEANGSSTRMEEICRNLISMPVAQML